MSGAFIQQFRLGPNVVSQALAAARRFAEIEDVGDRGDVLAVIVEELIFNLVDHGGGGDGDPIEFGLARLGAGIVLDLVDGGIAFDPRLADPAAPVPERGGGAGLALVRAWSRVLSYERIDRRNHLRLLIPTER